MFTFPCSQCGRKLRLAPGSARKARCPACQNLSDVPSTPTDTSPASEAPTFPPAGTEAPTLAPAPSTPGWTVRVPGYELLGLIGRGGMGVIYKARQLRPRRLVALKMILAGEHADQALLDRFRTEAEAAARLAHPNVVAVHEVGEQDGRPYLTLEYIAGGNLAEYLRAGSVAPREAAAFLLQLARAAHFAHEKGIVHRDLKPANILLQSTEDRPQDESASVSSATLFDSQRPPLSALVPKIADFGLAKCLDEASSLAQGAARTASGAILGTPQYMAPEQASGKRKKVGPAADVYALGAILYEMLVGQPPFAGETAVDIVLQVVSAVPVPPRKIRPKVPRDVELICLKCLEKEPEDRYASAGELAEDLQRFVNGEPIQARPAGALRRLRSWARRRKEVVFLAAGALVTGLVLALLLPRLLRQDARSQAATRPEDDPRAREERLKLLAAHATSANNLKQIMMALHDYHDSHQSLPPPALVDTQNRPILSWRVALLPYLQHDTLYKQFNLQEPWDGPNNIKLLTRMPNIFQSPAPGRPAPEGHTFYRVFTGPDTVFNMQWQPIGRNQVFAWPLRLPLTGITDGTSNTLGVYESGQAVPWTAPEVNPLPVGKRPPLGGIFGDRCHIGLMDCSVSTMRLDVPVESLRRLVNPQDGLVVPDNWGFKADTETDPQGPGASRGDIAPPARFRLGGKVSFKGKVIPEAQVTLHSGQGQTMIAPTDQAGQFVFARVAPGQYRVTVAGGKPRVPQKYGNPQTSPLSVNVSHDATFDLELSD